MTWFSEKQTVGIAGAAMLAAVLTFVPVWSMTVRAQESGSTNAADAEAVNQAMSVNAAVEAAQKAAAAEAASSSPDSLRSEISDLNTDVQKKKRDMDALNAKIKTYEQRVMDKKAEAASLEDEMALIENRIAEEQLAIDIARTEVRSLELEIGLLDRQIGEKEAQMAQERSLLGALARKLYSQQYKRSLLDILLTHSSFSDFFDEIHSLAKLQSAVDDTLVKIRGLKADLEAEKTDRDAKKQASLERKRQLEVSKMDLEDQRALKDQILTETKSSELEYRYLIADLKNEQSQADSEISYLQKVLSQKMTLADRLKGEQSVLSWPLVPTRGLSAIFHDPEYPFRYVFEHPAIDIRAGQGTPVRASAAGVVARAKNAGMGYSYVMIMHNSELSTVYGHLSKITAKEDTFVERGEIIGYSGGMPGTPGAGRLTTGPHLHFETRLNGIPVDPMRYLVAY